MSQLWKGMSMVPAEDMLEMEAERGALRAENEKLRAALKIYADADEDSPHKPQEARKALATGTLSEAKLEEK